MQTRLLLMAVAALGPAFGCVDRDLTPLNPCTQSNVVGSFLFNSIDKVDLLFMVDNSSSMSQEQLSLAEQVPRLVRVLASGDRDGDGSEDFPPVQDLQIGVISSDMGTGGRRQAPGSGCREPDVGDDGLLRTEGDVARAGCNAAYPKFLRFQPALGGSADDFARDVSCVALNLGTDGCGFEQQLEATLKAITPADCREPHCLFLNGTRGHAGPGGLNTIGDDLFIRPDSLLALVLVTDEEDCSAADPEIFNGNSTTYVEPAPNLRCFRFQNDARQPIHPIERYVDGFLATRTNPDLLVYAVIAGVPTDLTVPAAPGNPVVSFQGILDAPPMQQVVDPDRPGFLTPSCDTPSGFADPPRRLVEVAQQLEERGSNGIVQSICQEDFTPALDAVIGKIADLLDSACLPRDLNPDAFGLVECDVLETLPAVGDTTRCDQIPGRDLVERRTGGGEVCRVVQVGPGNDAAGWFYDTAEANPDVAASCGRDGQRIRFTAGNEPRNGTLVRLECLQPVQASAGPAFVDIDSPCTAFGERCDGGGPAPGAPGTRCVRDLICDGATRTFQMPCVSDADCPPGSRCDHLRTEGIGPSCVNPTCG